MPNLLEWLHDLLRPQSPEPRLDSEVAALASGWGVAPAVAWRIVQMYAVQRQVSPEVAAKALRGLGYEEAKVEVGEG